MAMVFPSATLAKMLAQWSDGCDVSRHTQFLQLEDALCRDGRLSGLLLLDGRLDALYGGVNLC